MDCNPLVNKNGSGKYYRLTTPIVMSVQCISLPFTSDGVFPLSQGTCCIEAMPTLGMSQCVPADELNKKSLQVMFIKLFTIRIISK